MKLVTAVVRPSAFDTVCEALGGIGVDSMTVTEVHGRGRQKGHTEVYRGTAVQVELLAKVKVEILVPDAVVERAVGVITDAARSGDDGAGRIGDGKVWVSPVEEAVRVRTGERGDPAL